MSDEATPPVEETSTPTPVNQRMASYGTALKNFFTVVSFSGRASRSEFWFAMTIFLPLSILLLFFKVAFLLSLVKQTGTFEVFRFLGHDALPDPVMFDPVMFIVSTVVWWWCMFLYWGALARRINDMGGAGSVAGLAFVVTIVQDLSLHFPLFSPLVMPLILLFINLYLMVAGLYGFVCSFIPSKMVENKYGPVPFCD